MVATVLLINIKTTRTLWRKSLRLQTRLIIVQRGSNNVGALMMAFQQMGRVYAFSNFWVMQQPCSNCVAINVMLLIKRQKSEELLYKRLKSFKTDERDGVRVTFYVLL